MKFIHPNNIIRFWLINTICEFLVDVFVYAISNDFCSGAIPLTIGTPIIVNRSDATIDTDSVPNDCNGVYPVYPGVWYTFTGTGQRLVAQSGFASKYPSYNALSVYKGECGPTTLQCVSAAWNLRGFKRFIFGTEPGTTYYALFQPHSDIPTELLIFESPSVPNDNCINATPFELESTITVNTTYATSDELDVSDTCSAGIASNPGVWYKFTGTGDRLVARACGSIYHHITLSVYTGSCGLSTMGCVGSTNNPCSHELLIFNTTLGTTYFLLLSSVQDHYYIDHDIVDLSIFTPNPVENDFCSDASLFPIGSTVIVNTTYATIDTGSVPNDCNGVSPSYPGVWYTFTGTGQRLVARSCEAISYSSYSAISVYKGECGPTTLQCVLAAGSLCDYLRFMFDTEPGITYYVLFQPYSDVPTELSIFESPLVPNDDCTNAALFDLESTIMVNTTYATSDELDVSDACLDGFASYPGVWYKFTGTGNRLVARSCGYINRYLSVYTGSCGLSTLECVGSTSSSCSRERFIFNTTLGTTYFLLLSFVAGQYSIDHEIVDLSIFTPDPVENDFCADATLFPVGTTVEVNSTYATIDTGSVPADCNGVSPSYPGVWYKVVGSGQILVATACDTAILEPSGAVSVYTGKCGPSTMQCVSAKWDLCDFDLEINTVIGSDYYILVQPYDDMTPMELLIYVSASSPSQEPSNSPTLSPTMAPTKEPCVLFGNSIFCPFTFRGIFGRWIRKLFGLPE